MFDNRIEVISPGELLRPLTIENLDYKPKSRNKTIVDVFLRRKLMDKRGSGILRMREAMKEWKLPKPRFEENTGYFVIKFTGPYQETVIEYKEKLNERQKIVLNYLSKHKKIFRTEYSSLTKCSIRTSFNDLQDLAAKKLVEQKGVGKYTYYLLIK